MNFKRVPGYEKLEAVMIDAYHQAAEGKGAERHDDGLPFHEQPMQVTSDMLDSDAGLAFQVIKKVREGRNLPHAQRERELLGAMNYLAGMVIFHRRKIAEAITSADPCCDGRGCVACTHARPLSEQRAVIIGVDLAKGSDVGATVTGHTGGGRLVIDEVKFDDKRADAIGQNGNDGEHYNVLDEKSLRFKRMADQLEARAGVEAGARELRRSPDPKPKPAQVVLPNTDKMVDVTGRPKWSDLPKWVQWLGQDRAGVWTGFIAKPEPVAGRWVSTKRFIELNSGEVLIGENWTHMLEERP